MEDERKDADNKREKESLHLKQGGIVSVYLDNNLQPQANDEEEKNRKFEDMLTKEGQDLQDEVNALVAEIDRVNRERDEQNRRYNQQIKSKDDILN